MRILKAILFVLVDVAAVLMAITILPYHRVIGIALLVGAALPILPFILLFILSFHPKTRKIADKLFGFEDDVKEGEKGGLDEL